MVHQAGNRANALHLNCPEAPDNCGWIEFPIGIDVGQALADGLHRDVLQHGPSGAAESEGVRPSGGTPDDVRDQAP